MIRAHAAQAALLSAALTSALSCGGSTRMEPRFVAVHNAMSAMGLAQTGPISEGSLPNGADARVDIELRAGECYTIVALGDSGVQDLDVRVVSEDDEEIGRDVTHDRQAAAHVCPERSGPYQVVVAMAEGGGGYLLSSWSGAPRGVAVATGGGGGAATAGGPGTCDEPIALELGSPVTGDTTGGMQRTQGSCAPGSAPERVYRMEIEQRAQVSIALESTFDGALYVLRQCGQIGSVLECNDDAGDTSHSRIDTTLEPGTYFLVVDGYGDAAGAYTLQVDAVPLRSVSAVCGDAVQLTAGQGVSGTTVGTPDYFQATCAGGARAPDRVYRIDVPQRMRMRVRQNSDHDGAVYVRTSCADANSEIACNDDFGNNRRSLITTVVDPGQYFVFADGYSGGGGTQQGNFRLTAELASVQGGGAHGDTCAAPAPLPARGQQATIDTFEASDDNQGSCGGRGAPDVMYAVDVQNRSRLTAILREPEFAGAMYVQSTCGDQTSEVTCAPIAAAGAQETRLQTMLNPGQYVLVFDGDRPEGFGSANVEIELADLTALERACRTAPVLRDGRTVNGNTTGGTDDFQATCANHARSNDTIYRVQVRRRSRVRIDMSSDYDGALHLRRDCLDPSTEVACNDDHGDNRHARLETTLDRGTYFLIVDGFSQGSQGSFSLEMDVSRP